MKIASVQVQPTRADFDLDQDSDLFDYGAFAVCHVGDAPAKCASQACQDVFDFAYECDVDETGYGRFFDFLTPPNITTARIFDDDGDIDMGDVASLLIVFAG